MGGKQTRLAEKRSTVRSWSTRTLSQRVSLISCHCLRVFQSCCSSSATASKPAKQSIEIRSLSRSTYHRRSFLDNQVGDLASKSEGAHTASVLFEFTEKRWMNEASAIWDLKGLSRRLVCPAPPKSEFSRERHLAVHCSRVAKESTTMVRLAGGRYGSQGQCSVRRPFRRGCFPRSQACLRAGRSMTVQSPLVGELSRLEHVPLPLKLAVCWSRAPLLLSAKSGS